MISLVNICKKFKNKVVINNFSYQFNDTGLYFLVGKSGIGKTTLLNILAGITKPTSGRVIYDNIKSIYADSYYIYQDFNLIPNLSLIDNIKLVLSIKKIQVADCIIDEKLDEIGLLDLKKEITSNLSGGERQRLTIVIGLLLNSKVIFLDEPTASLDDKNAEIIIELLRKISLDKLIIISTHNKKYINQDDFVIDLENQIYKEIKINQLQYVKQKKINFGINIFYIKSKIIKRQYIRFLFQLICLISVFTASAFLIPLSHMSEEELMVKEILNDSQRIIVDLSTANYNLYNDYNKLNGYVYYNTLEYDSKEIKTDTIFIDDTLQDDEIVISSSAMPDDYFDCIGKNMCISGYTYKIKAIDYFENTKSSWNKFNYLRVNTTVFSKISNKNSGKLSLSKSFSFYLNDNLEENCCILPKSLYDSYYKDKNIGDYIEISLTENNRFMDYKKSLKLVGITDGDTGHIDSNSYFDFYTKCSNFNYFMLTKLNNKELIINAIDLLKQDEALYFYNNDYMVINASQFFLGLYHLYLGLIPATLSLAIILALFIVYNLLKDNRRNFDTLRLLGVSKKSIYSICLLDQIESVILALVISMFAIVQFGNYYLQVIEGFINTKINITFIFYDIKYAFITSFFSLLIISMLCMLFIAIKNKKNTYIN